MVDSSQYAPRELVAGRSKSARRVDRRPRPAIGRRFPFYDATMASSFVSRTTSGSLACNPGSERQGSAHAPSGICNGLRITGFLSEAGKRKPQKVSTAALHFLVRPSNAGIRPMDGFTASRRTRNDHAFAMSGGTSCDPRPIPSRQFPVEATKTNEPNHPAPRSVMLSEATQNVSASTLNPGISGVLCCRGRPP